MKITVELTDNDLKDILRISGEKKKGPAIRKFITTELMLQRRREISRKILKGELSADISLTKHKRDLDIWKA